MQMGITGRKLQDLAVCALLHDNALTQYIQEEFHNDISHVDSIKELPHAGAHLYDSGARLQYHNLFYGK